MSFLSTSETLPPAFSLQDALTIWNPFSTHFDEDYATLYTNGCNQTDGTTNCTAACLNSTEAFRTLESLHNCFLYTGIADLYAHSFLSSNDTKVADGFMIQKSNLNSSLSQNIRSNIIACFNAHCDGLPNCAIVGTSGSDTTPSYYLYSGDTVFNGLYENADGLCENITQPITLNADIGGVGVYASYWVQCGLALLGTFLILLWGWGSRSAYLMLFSRGYSQ